MQQEQSSQIFAQLANHEARLNRLEGKARPIAPNVASGKKKTLREIVRGKKFKNGQEQVAAIVGYYEKVVGQLIQKDKIKEEWVSAKMTNKFSTEFISRAKGTLIRVLNGGACDLTQTGEEFFDRLVDNESLDATSE